MSEKEISPTIKLFGKTIPLASAPLNGHEVPTNDDPPCGDSASAVDSKTAAATGGGAAVEEEDCSVKLPSCSETTSPDEQENKVCVKFETFEYCIVPFRII